MGTRLRGWQIGRRWLTTTRGITVCLFPSFLFFSLLTTTPLAAHITTVGKAMSSPEDIAYPILRKHDVTHVLVIFGGLIGYSGDDINKVPVDGAHRAGCLAR